MSVRAAAEPSAFIDIGVPIDTQASAGVIQRAKIKEAQFLISDSVRRVRAEALRMAKGNHPNFDHSEVLGCCVEGWGRGLQPPATVIEYLSDLERTVVPISREYLNSVRQANYIKLAGVIILFIAGAIALIALGGQKPLLAPMSVAIAGGSVLAVGFLLHGLKYRSFSKKISNWVSMQEIAMRPILPLFDDKADTIATGCEQLFTAGAAAAKVAEGGYIGASRIYVLKIPTGHPNGTFYVVTGRKVFNHDGWKQDASGPYPMETPPSTYLKGATPLV